MHQREQQEHQYEEEEVEKQLQLRRSTGQRKPNPKYTNVTEVMEEKEPIYEYASQKEKQVKAMEEEISTLEQNKTWELVVRSRDVKPISCKQV